MTTPDYIPSRQHALVMQERRFDKIPTGSVLPIVHTGFGAETAGPRGFIAAIAREGSGRGRRKRCWGFSRLRRAVMKLRFSSKVRFGWSIWEAEDFLSERIFREQQEQQLQNGSANFVEEHWVARNEYWQWSPLFRLRWGKNKILIKTE